MDPRFSNLYTPVDQWRQFNVALEYYQSVERKQILRQFQEGKYTECSLVAWCHPQDIMQNKLEYLYHDCIVYPMVSKHLKPPNHMLNSSYANIELQQYRDMAVWTFFMRHPIATHKLNGTCTMENFEPYFIKCNQSINISEEDVTFREIIDAKMKLNNYSVYEIPTIAMDLIKHRHIKVYSVAFALTIRQRMLEIQNRNTNFSWDFKIDPEITKVALKFIQMCDEYLFTVFSSN